MRSGMRLLCAAIPPSSITFFSLVSSSVVLSTTTHGRGAGIDRKGSETSAEERERHSSIEGVGSSWTFCHQRVTSKGCIASGFH